MKSRLLLLLLTACVLLSAAACGAAQTAPAADAAAAPSAPTATPDVAEAAPEPADEPAADAYTWDSLPFSAQVPKKGGFALVNQYDAFLSVEADQDTLCLSAEPCLWTLGTSRRGSHILLGADPKLMFDLHNAYYNSGTSVHLHGDTGYLCQYWDFTAYGDGFIITSAEDPDWCVLSRERGFCLGRTDDVTENDIWRIIESGPWTEEFVSDAQAPFYHPDYSAKSYSPNPAFWEKLDAEGVTDAMKAEDVHVADCCAQYVIVTPVFSGTSETFDCFSVDFRTETQPDYTYWSLVNWGMDISEYMSRKGYENADNIGAYAGLQDVGSYTTGIMSMWETCFYSADGEQEEVLVPTCLYPEGQSTQFSNEGSGTSLVTPFDWSAGRWYRFVIRSWTHDEDSTYVGTWVEDLDSGEVSLLAVYDTHLPDSFMYGGMSLFLENYNGETYGELRQMQLKNICARDAVSQEWHYVDSVSMRIWTDLGFNQGSYRYSAADGVFTAETCGLGENVCEGLEDEETNHLLRAQPGHEPPDLALYTFDGQ